MTPELDATLNVVLGKALEVAQASGDFLVEQTPEIVQQLLVWDMTESVVVNLIVVITFLLVAKGISKTYKLGYENGDYFYKPEVMFNVVWTVPLLIGASNLNLVWLKILIAPKLYLLEYASKLVN